MSKEIDIDAIVHKAVKETFYVLGIDVDSPKDVEEFRKDLRFGQSMRAFADKGKVAFVIAVAGGLAAALWVGLVEKIKGGG